MSVRPRGNLLTQSLSHKDTKDSSPTLTKETSPETWLQVESLKAQIKLKTDEVIQLNEAMEEVKNVSAAEIEKERMKALALETEVSELQEIIQKVKESEESASQYNDELIGNIFFI
jgi:hypothetical protein